MKSVSSSIMTSPCYLENSDKECGFPKRLDGKKDRRYKSPQVLKKNKTRDKRYMLTSQRRMRLEKKHRSH